MKRTYHVASLLLLGIAGSVASPGADNVFRSGPAHVSLVELYTSEGCSSCPPAEKWLGELRGAPGLWKEFVPIALHVNYWDHLGWRDVLAAKDYTAREYAYADAWHAGSVYTPCFVRDGVEWQPRGGSVEHDAAASATDAGTLSVARETDGTCRLEYAAGASTAKKATVATAAKRAGASAADNYDAWVALLGSEIVSQVRAGENAGRELRHEFVALRLEHVALVRDANGVFAATLQLPPRTDIAAPRRAIAAWVTHHGELAPLQATGGWLP
jgi:hypothetical protein